MRLLSPISGRAAVALWFMAVTVAWIVINVTDAGNAPFRHLWPPDHPDWFAVLVAVAGLLIGPACSLRVARTYGMGSYVGRAVLLFGAGMAMWAFGNVVWFWYNTCGAWPAALGCARGTVSPYPSLSDVGFLLAVPLYVAGLLTLCKPLGLGWRDVRTQWWLPALIVFITGYFSLPAVHIGPLEYGHSWVFESGYTPTQSVFSTLYVISDMTIMTIALLLLARARHTVGGMLFRPLLLASASFIVLYLGDMLFDQRHSSGVYYNGDISDGLYALSFALMLVAFLVFVREHVQLSGRLVERAAARSAAVEGVS